MPKVRTVNHGHTKPRRGAKPDARERAHMARVASMPCLVSGETATVHHVTAHSDRMGRLSRSHELVVPLAPRYHLIQHGSRESVEALGHRGFYEMHGVDLMKEAEFLRLEIQIEGLL